MEIELESMSGDFADLVGSLGVGAEPIPILSSGEVVAAIISAEDYEFLSQLKTRMAIQVLREELSNTSSDDWKPLERLINKLAEGLENAGRHTSL